MVVVDLVFDRHVSWGTLGKSIAASLVILAYFYLVRVPRLRDR
jgi:hypothetical protein